MSVKNAFLYLFLIIFTLFSAVSVILYSSQLANINFIIHLRNQVLNKLDYIIPQGVFLYKIRAIKIEEDGTYVYKFPGKFDSIDFKNQTITLLDINDKKWTFKYFTNKKSDGSWSRYESIDYRYVLKEWGKKPIESIYKIVVDTENPDTSISHFSEGDLIVLYWSDDRNLPKLLDDIKTGKTVILNGSKMIQINKVVWKN